MSRHGRLATAAAALFAATTSVGSAAKAEVDVVATIPAVHSIASGVMAGVATPHLLIPGGASPHTFSLKPSDAQALQESDLVVWVGPQIETFLDGKLDDLAPNAEHVTMEDVDGITLLDFREGGLWERHDHSHGHGDHDDHGHEDASHENHGHDDHGHEEEAHHDHGHDDHGHEKKDAHGDHGHDHHAHDDHGHDDHGHDHHEHEKKDVHAHDDHDHSGADGHVWLDPTNATALSAAIAEALSEKDPANAERYLANHAEQKAALEALDAEIAESLAAVQDVPFLVFHDAYQYAEKRYGLNGVGSVTVSPEVAPGAARVRAIQERLATHSVACVFAEPQFEPRILEVITEGTQTRSGILDPVGAEIEPGADMYAQLMRNLAGALTGCLAAS